MPVFFDKVHILKDPGYNTASWNVSQRKITIDDDGNVRANEIVVYELWRWYREQVAQATSAAVPDRYWAFGQFEDGTPIERAHRLLYRDRQDLQAHFKDPFSSDFVAWLRAEGRIAA